MNKTIAIVIGSIIGAAVGGGVVYIYLNRKYDVIFEKETESYINEIKDLKDENTSLHKRLVKKLGESKEKFFEKENVVVPDSVNDDILDDEDDDGYDIEPTKSDKSEIRFISKRDYDDDEDYNKEEIEYYMANGKIVQDNDILSVEEFESVCGVSALPLLRKDKSLSRWSSAGDNELYIRNEGYDTDYKIIRQHIAYDG